jgi:hypothetical protein
VAVRGGRWQSRRRSTLRQACGSPLPGDGGVDFVDALIVAPAERLGVHTLLTLDRRHLGLVHPRHRPAFALLPE